MIRGETRHDRSATPWQVFAFEGFSGHPTDPIRWSFPFVEAHWLPLLTDGFHDCAVHYCSQRDSCVREAVNTAVSLGTTACRGFVVLGYSCGGHGAIQFARALAKRGFPISLGLTADPVPKGLAMFGAAREVLVKPSGVRRWVNFYQRTDRGSLAGIVPLRGHPVLGASVNRKVETLGSRGHVRLPSYPELLASMRQELNRCVTF